jgi:hypothetical protein
MFNVRAQLYACSVCGAVYAQRTRTFPRRWETIPEKIACSAHPEAEMIDLDLKANDECETEVYLGSTK